MRWGEIAAGNNKNNQSEYRRYKNRGHFIFMKHLGDKLTDRKIRVFSKGISPSGPN